MINKNDNSLASSAKRSALSVASPTKLNIMSSQNGNTKLHKVTKRPLERSHSLNIKNGNANEPFGKFSRPKISVQAPPLLKRNSSFSKKNQLLCIRDQTLHSIHLLNLRNYQRAPCRPRNLCQMMILLP